MTIQVCFEHIFLGTFLFKRLSVKYSLVIVLIRLNITIKLHVHTLRH